MVAMGNTPSPHGQVHGSALPHPAASRTTQSPRYTSLTTFFCFSTLFEPRTKAGSFQGNVVGTGDPTDAKMQHPSRARDGLQPCIILISECW